MNDFNNGLHGIDCPSATGAGTLCLLPSDVVELIELRSASIEHRLGYFRNEPFVMFGYCPGGGEVMWKDGHSSGFGTGGWKIFLQEIAPLAARQGASLGDLTSAGTHVLLMDRIRGTVYAAPRESAERLFSRVYGIARPKRQCLCSLTGCAACMAHFSSQPRPDNQGTLDGSGSRST